MGGDTVAIVVCNVVPLIALQCVYARKVSYAFDNRGTYKSFFARLASETQDLVFILVWLLYNWALVLVPAIRSIFVWCLRMIDLLFALRAIYLNRDTATLPRGVPGKLSCLLNLDVGLAVGSLTALFVSWLYDSLALPRRGFIVTAVQTFKSTPTIL